MTDIGLAALARIHARLMIDEEWTVRRERGFSWIAKDLVQHFDASPVFESRDLQVSQVVVQTRLVAEIREASHTVQEFLALMNSSAIGSALFLSEEEQSVFFILAHTVHEETLEFRVDQLADYAILQLIEGEARAESYAEIFKGIPAFSDHPTKGRRENPDEMLNAARDIFLPKGRNPSLFAVPSEFAAVYQSLVDTPCASLGYFDEGISIEVPFGPYDTSLIELRNDVDHPLLGSGLSVRTTVRTDENVPAPVLFAGSVQQAQLRTVNGGGQFGAWGVRENLETPHIAWSRFVPNAMFRSGLILDVAMGEVNRAVWLDSVLYSDLPPRNAWELMKKREALRESAARSGSVS